MDCYKTLRVQTELHLSRENLVGLAVLLGCDYIPKVQSGNESPRCANKRVTEVTCVKYALMMPFFHKGIPGVGKEQALKLLRMLKEQTLLQW